MSAVAARSIRIGVAATLLRGAFAEQRLRALLGIGAIALGVALGYAVQLINAAAIGEITRSARALSGSADLEVTRAAERLRRGRSTRSSRAVPTWPSRVRWSRSRRRCRSATTHCGSSASTSSRPRGSTRRG